MEDVEDVLKKMGVGIRSACDSFFEETYNNFKIFERQGAIVEDEEELCHTFMKEFPCNACNTIFYNLLDYELHYHDTHHFVCSECKKWKPTSRLLEIHIQEAHDSFFKVLVDKQPMYECFVINCNVKFNNAQERTDHCREFHEFPKNYRYDEYPHAKAFSKNDSTMDVDGSKLEYKKSLKRHFGNRMKCKAFTKDNSNIKKSAEMKIDDSKTKTKAPFKLSTAFIPRQVKQKSYTKLLTQNKELKKNVIESESIMELGDLLPNI